MDMKYLVTLSTLFFLIADCLSGCFDIEFRTVRRLRMQRQNRNRRTVPEFLVKHWKDSRYNRKKNKVLRVTIFHI